MARAGTKPRALRRSLTAFAVVVLGATWATGADLGRRVLVLRQQVDAQGASRLAVQASIAVSTVAGLDVDRFASPVPPPAGFAGFALPSVAPGSRPGDVTARAAAVISRQAPAIVDRLAQWMAARGDSAAWSSLEQSMTLGRHDRVLVWTAHLDHQGRAIYGAPQLIDPDPWTLVVRYVPLAVRSGLPADWTYQGAGTLSWQVRDAKGGTVAPWRTVDVHGAFDAPEVGVRDPEAGLRCLMNARATLGCPPRWPDVVGLVDATGASSAVVDYVRSVTPEYRSDPVHGSAASAAIDVYRRTLRRGGCGAGCVAVYSNRYRIGYRLVFAVDRIGFRPDGGWTPLARVSLTGVSPLQDTERRLPLAAAQADDIASKLIRPDTGVLVDMTTMPAGMLVHVASVDTE
jgi:hypothetical protein